MRLRSTAGPSRPRFIIAALVCLALVYAGGFVPAPSGWQVDIDITSGRLRSTKYVLGVPVRRVIRQSLISRLSLTPGSERADWHPVASGYPGSHFSPHYRFHGAIHQIRVLELAWGTAAFSPMAKRASAARVLQLWQRDGGDFAAGRHVQKIWELADSRRGGAIETHDLPGP